MISDYLFQKASARKVPLSGTFELSPVCNFACKMCYVRKTPGQLQEEGKTLIPWQDWLELAEQCRGAGTLYLLLTGGEPFLYPGFRELYERLHAMGFLLSINTNGTLLDEETVAWLKARTGGLGWFSWTDFVLGEVFGISECRDESLLLAALAPAVRDEALAGRQIADQLWAYISADRDSLRTYCEWIGGIL